ncbi:MAG: leucyl aminopeptidase [Gemmatimonadetes bacterium]|nr:leucyl aminopeptidase [Gemmatimonadota bacterium]
MSIAVTLAGGDPAALRAALLAVPLAAGAALPRSLARLDRATGGALGRAIAERDFRGARDETFVAYTKGRGPERVMLVGAGAGELTTASLGRAATLVGRKANGMGVGRVAFWCASGKKADVEQTVISVLLGAWEYRELKAKPSAAERRRPLESVVVAVSKVGADARAGLAAGKAIADGQAIARKLAMMPGNLCTPEFIAATAQDVAKRHGLKCTVRGRKEMQALGMNTFLAVAQGTPQDPKFITIEYKSGTGAPVCLVGKGLCFDTGGISIKPADRMEWMKFDMCGAAGVIGAMEAIARMKLKVNVVGLIGSTTNMPSGTAINPGDVVKSLCGKTVEIINTDAEGRLVLADVLTYAAREYKPRVIVDAATLTGAVVVALGSNATGVMANTQDVADELLAAGKRAGEPGWQLPQWAEYKEQLKSDVADLKNIGGRGGGTITAGLFLSEFVEGVAWGHLDIAGTAYTETDLGIIGRGPTGVPVRTFVEFARARQS